jgi:hypothetical protein
MTAPMNAGHGGDPVHTVLLPVFGPNSRAVTDLPRLDRAGFLAGGAA